tara:strand:+ start:102 stop:1022 length:921 start_codon:yes stop_codon:yes gene_type:complete
MNILIIKHGSIGDFVMSIGSIMSIRNKFPKKKIYLLTTTLIKNIFFQIPYIDQIFIDDRKSNLNFVKYLSKIKKLKISLVIDLQNSQRTEMYHLCTRVLCRNVKINSARKFAHFKYKNPPHGYEHVCEGLNNQLKLININKFLKPNIDWLKNKNFNNPIKKKYVVLIPGSSKSGANKRWPANFFSDLSDIFIENGFDVIVTGAHSDRDIIQEIKKFNSKIIKSDYLSHFSNFINLCNESSLIISVDTGPAQMAAFSNKPFIWLVKKGLYDVTNIPISEQIQVIKADEMQNISVQEVAKVSKKILNI